MRTALDAANEATLELVAEQAEHIAGLSVVTDYLGRDVREEWQDLARRARAELAKLTR
jgi:hypothetical protein